MAANQKFFEIIKPGINLEFIGNQKYWIGASITLLLVTFLMLPINAYVIKGRGHMLNWGVEFRGGTEIVVDFAKPVDAGAVRAALAAKGFDNADVVKYGSAMERGSSNAYMIRLGAVSVMSSEQAKKVEVALARVGDAILKKFEFSEGGDKVYIRFDRALDPAELAAALKAAGTSTTDKGVQQFGPPQDHTYEATLVGMESEVRAALDAKLGAGTVSSIPQVSSVGAKAGRSSSSTESGRCWVPSCSSSSTSPSASTSATAPAPSWPSCTMPSSRWVPSQSPTRSSRSLPWRRS